MSTVSENPTPLGEADLTAPLKTVQETAAGFSTDMVRWVDQSSTHALLIICAVIGAGVALALLRFLLLRLIGYNRELHRRGWRMVSHRLIRNTSVLFLLVLGGWALGQYIKLPRGVMAGFDLALLISGFFQLGLLGKEIVLLLLERRLARTHGHSDVPITSALSVINWMVNLIVWSLVTLLLLGNLGVNITALVAGLGIGGLALGLAAQGIISDLFSALSIVFDRPFVRGDLISFGGRQGTIERIGLKTSRLRAVTGEMLVVANNQLLGEVIHNHQQMDERRVIFTLGVTYDTTPAQLEATAVIIREAIKAQNLCRFDRAHLVQLGESALTFEAVYYFGGREYAPYLDAHQAILLRIIRELADRKISLAFPTQTIYLKRDPAGHQM